MHKEKEKAEISSNKSLLFSNSLLHSFLNNRFTVLYGLRRSGKSYFVKNLFSSLLAEKEIESVLYLDLEEVSKLGIKGDEEFFEYIKTKVKNFSFLIIDEVSFIENFALLFRVLKSFPNAHFLLVSSVSIDYLDSLKGKKDSNLAFFYFSPLLSLREEDDLLAFSDFGFLPSLRAMEEDAKKDFYLDKLVNHIFLTDLTKREGIQSDFTLKRILSLLSLNIGNHLNSKALSKLYFSKYEHTIDFKTIEKCLSGLEKSFLIKEVSRLDLKENKNIGGLYKYYFLDPSVARAIQGVSFAHVGNFLEELIAIILESWNILFWNGFYYSFYTNELGKRARRQEYIDFVFYKDKKLVLTQVINKGSSSKEITVKRDALRKITRRSLKMMVFEDLSSSKTDEYGILSLSIQEFYKYFEN